MWEKVKKASIVLGVVLSIITSVSWLGSLVQVWMNYEKIVEFIDTELDELKVIKTRVNEWHAIKIRDHELRLRSLEKISGELNKPTNSIGDN